jgi:uncharacterized membrane protein HdeD (DUF308 family)
MSSISADAVTVGDRRFDRMLWWLAILAAAASVVLGVMVVAWPDATLFVGAVLFGIWLVVHGVVYIVQAITATAADGAVRALHGILGVLFVVGGVFCLRNVLVSLLAIATVIGVTWLIGGIVGLASAFTSAYSGQVRLVAGLLGGLTVLGGLAVLLWPGLSLVTLVYLTGFWLIAMGILQFFLILRTRPRS